MGWSEKIFDINSIIKKDGKIVIINIEEIDGDLEKLIDELIVSICFGDECFKLEYAKEYIRDFLNTTDEDRKKGAISEFFIHLYLRSKGLTQDCLYTNLEENSPKKGFDGIYSKKDVVWYMESKSGSNKTNEHKDKIGEAYRDLSNKFTGKVKNNPWMNAFNHAKMVNANADILTTFSNYSMTFKSTSHDIANFNIIPAGTVFLDDKSVQYNPHDICKSVSAYLSKKSYAKVVGICVSQKAIGEFEKYLK